MLIVILLPKVVHSQVNDKLAHDIQLYKNAVLTDDYTIANESLDQIIKHYNAKYNFDSTLFYTEKLITLAEQNDDLETELDARLQFCSIQMMFSKADNKDIRNEKMRILNKLDTLKCSNELSGQVYSSIKDMYKEEGKIDSAILYQKEAVRFADKGDEAKHRIFQRLSLASIYQSANQYGNALEVLLSAEDIVESNPYLESIVQIRFNRKFGSLLMYIGDYDKAEIYLEKAKIIAEEKDYQLFLAYIHSTYSILYFGKGEMKKSVSYLEKAFDYFKSKGMKSDESKALMLYAKYYSRINDSVKLDSVINEYIALVGHTELELELLQSIDIIENNRVDELHKVKSILQKIENADLPSNVILEHKSLKYKYELAVGNYKNAITAQKELNAHQDSVRKSQKDLIVQRLESEYNRKQQDREIASLNQLTALQNKSITTRTIALIAGSLMLAVLLLLYRSNKAKNVKLEKALEDNRTLLNEIHHRVKNNLQVVSSLLAMQARRTEDNDAKEALKSSKSRIQSMSILHQNLYQEDNLKDVDVKGYLHELAKSIFVSYNTNDNVELNLDVDPISIDVDTLIPLGLITNELIINALKHAFPNQASGEITVSVKENREAIILSVIDNGIGVDAPQLPINSKSLGAQLIQSFAARLDGEIKVDNKNGTAIAIKIDKRKLSSNK